VSARILVTDDDETSCGLFAEVLTGEGYEVECAKTGEEALARLRQDGYDLLIVDIRMPGMSGLDVTRAVRKSTPSLPIVVMTAFGSMETAVAAIREGAFDYISKPLKLEGIKQAVSRALTQRELPGQAERREDGSEAGARLGAIIGSTPAMVEVYKTVARVAPTHSTVLLLGESGTGKELVARAIHQHSLRARRPFVAVDCGALTETLLESELFGHVRGAFTGAIMDKKGVFEEAQGGTCFLDEIGNVSLYMQTKLLHVLQEREVRRVGGQEWVKVEVRIVAATNKDLIELVRQGAFRQDLYYRLKVVTIALPFLRERAEDIPALAYHFLKRYSQENGKFVPVISDEAMDLLRAYSWPGNIRELENVIERAVALSNQPMLTPTDLPVEVCEHVAARPSHGLFREDQSPFADTPTLEEVKKRYVLHVLHNTQGNLSHAAELLDVDRRSLYRMLGRYKITPSRKE
jgi:two-component system response regulator AtoC